jgi:hypothetical protein
MINANWFCRVSAMLFVLMKFTLPDTAFANNPTVIKETKNSVSPALRDIVVKAQSANAQQGHVPLPTGAPITNSQADPVAHSPSDLSLPITSGLNFDGVSAADTVASGGPFVPPDTNGAVGATQVVQWVNVTFKVFDKRTGSLVIGPTPGNAFWTGFGGPCETRNDGDIIIQYDKIADRWVAAQPVFVAPYMYCIAVSTTSDATGTYNQYAFPVMNNEFPDYPKLGVWPDAYYATFNMFTQLFVGAQACAYDRANMLAGNPATAVCFQEPSNVSSLLPSDLDGKTLPPAGSPNFIVGLADSTHLNFFKFHVDFANPGSSSFAGPTLISAAPFSEICNRSVNLACIPEPPPGEKVDAISDRVMYRLAYRNFGDHESLVANHTVSGGALAGVRWYEIRNPSSTPSVFQQGTVVDPSTNFWMGSIAMDQIGDIALGFSASSTSLDPSVQVVGRVPSDAAGNIRIASNVGLTGTGVQQASFHRWGDYSSMSVDPKDDCTFWYTQEYYVTSGSFNWSTRIISFKFNSCH